MRAAFVLAALALAAPAHAGKHRDRTKEIVAAVEASLPDALGAIEFDVPDELVRARGQVRVDWSRAPRAGWTSVEVTVGSREAWVRVELGAMRPVVIALRALEVGHVIGEGDLGLAARPVEGLDVDAAALAGSLVLRDVAADVTLTDEDVELPAALARGDEVDVVVRRGNLTVSSRGTLEASARVGEQVAVRIVATRVILRGRLSAATTVVIP